MVYACNGLFAKLWIFQLQNSVFFTCNFLHFYLTTNIDVEYYNEHIGNDDVTAINGNGNS